MHNIVLEPADNGIIKIIKDNNINGGGNVLDIKKIYEFNDNHIKTIDFFYDLADDLGIELGNIHSKDIITIDRQWGLSYKPNQIELKNKITELREELLKLETEYMYTYGK